MAGISVPSLILLIVSIVITTDVLGVPTDVVTGISSSLDERGDDMSTETRTDIEVISDPQAGVYDGGSNGLSIYVRNTGLRTPPAASGSFDIIVGG